MPTLPSGRRVEFSLDRFHALLRQMDHDEARALAATLQEPDDLLYVLDAVHFGLADGQPYFADYVAADWRAAAADWNTADREALQTWLASDEARFRRAEAIRYIRALLLERPGRAVAFPYATLGDMGHPHAIQGSLLRQ
ncbi:hypothetical protein RHDC4_01259 [Rhodocyclaceae bacterium]|nr:hypothetical protein RHDC4_01259 [Rhodocyclaceae bacterium]